ncbi:DNA-directed DNA polymerase [Magnetococcus marinus MC-1]|uniref:DNA-directed DNA polymerase n=2 Tax=Magnetococcus TaxID=162171 RepID=A0L9G4_MAGMM|nr:DNA-directed DNA polymerase [Magnetococcus marinus MC-1]
MSYALVDCNNFYASCERLFQPHLEGKPVVVLSNNDGCAIARSNEAKQLGIAMGAPLHQIQALIKQHQVALFSSNYPLYGDLSARVMRTLEQLAPRVEIYSIDEAFLDLQGMPAPQRQILGRTIHQQVKRWTGIPVSVGIGPTKTLAKVANRFAKKSPKTEGVLDLSDPQWCRKALHQLPVGEVWGVGPRWAKRLNQAGIDTALQLSRMPPPLARQQFNVVLERTVRELRGESVIPFAALPAARQSIATTRTFGQKIHTHDEIKEAISSFTVRAAEKLRKQGLLAAALHLFITTNRFSEQDLQYKNSLTWSFQQPQDDTLTLLTGAHAALDAIYRPGYRYQKAGVILLGLVSAQHFQPSLFAPPPRLPNSRALMRTLDGLNQKMGRGTVRFGAEGPPKPSWGMRQLQRSPAYTTRWSDLPQV